MRFPIEGRPRRGKVVAIAALFLAMPTLDALVGGLLGLVVGAILVLALLGGLYFSLRSPDWYVALDDNSVEVRSILHKRIPFTKIVSVGTPMSHRVVFRFKDFVGWRIGPVPIPQGSMIIRMDDPTTFVAEVQKHIRSAPQAAP
jgi:hypothetical protein